MRHVSAPLVVFGCGFTGTAAAAMRRAEGGRVIATTRDEARAAALARAGIEAHVIPALGVEAAAKLVPEGAEVLVAFPPDPAADAAVAAALEGARAVVYVSSTAVYGGATGKVDELVPVDRGDARAAARLDAEAHYQRRGAVILRAAGIYGPGRGLHRRLMRGEHRLVEGGHKVVSRIHVEDLARLALASLEQGLRGDVFVVGDDAPVPQVDVVRWLCQRLGLPLPVEVEAGAVHETLRHDRAVQNARIKSALGLSLQYPSYREGFEACLALEAARGTY
ncbi:NAD-dependent epimerase/dehydratase family protein [Chondromyces crocatus]|uniref:Nucleoside-diphosphate-sugar epimerase n=1 Tax=Chondromyces crocatus TaxID=52 RepID=A0A0K1EEL7_CHOCO|nr:NAD-dependent epimerase/dehydratase family protein [Chondromyces crocatus]AKT39299.1 nucleoside-diphosphate-sugar epimerase [Chondromyces crocatus]